MRLKLLVDHVFSFELDRFPSLKSPQTCVLYQTDISNSAWIRTGQSEVIVLNAESISSSFSDYNLNCRFFYSKSSIKHHYFRLTGPYPSAVRNIRLIKN